MMPFSKDSGVREDGRYCSYCYSDGTLHAEGMQLRDFKQLTFTAMREKGISWPMAKFYTWMIGFAPYWKERS
jgi:hypothetical protein